MALWKLANPMNIFYVNLGETGRLLGIAQEPAYMLFGEFL